jgi:uncharacterized membrane protein YhhN
VTRLAAALLGAAGTSAVGDWLAVATCRRRAEQVAKPLTLALLLGVALALEPASATQRAWFAAALVLSLLGDVCLLFPEDGFVPGLGAFLGAHVAYIGGLRVAGWSSAGLALAAAAVAVVAVPLGTRIIASVRAGGHGSLTMPIAAYMVVLGAMVASAIATGSVLAAAGASLFLVSDSLIAWHRFVRALDFAPVAIMVTYHLGQAGLTLSLIR